MQECYPTLKEVVERLFTSGLIQLLFTTETFAVGINMPACTVVFDSLEKYDGVNFRYLKAREYHQMAGRAGRRGIDEIGYVYSQIEPLNATYPEVSKAVSKTIEPINSQFNLSYSSILNLYEKFGEGIYDVYTMSLSNHQNFKIISELRKKIDQQDKKKEQLPLPTCIHDNIDAIKQIAGYYRQKRNTNDSLERLYVELATLKSRLPKGKSGKKEQKKKFEPINSEIKRLQSDFSNNLCTECHQQKKCLNRYQAIRKHEQYITNLKKKQTSIESYHQEHIGARLNVLKSLGYIESEALLPRGNTASHIYGYELQLTQLLYNGFFERMTEDEINCLMITIVSEPRKDGYFKKLKEKKMLSILGAATDEIMYIRKLEDKLNVTELVPYLETRLCTAMLAWSRGCSFDELPEYADIDDGDFVRSFRLVIDQLRQIRRSMTGHTTLTEKLNRCIGKINRDIVDAERQLRIGQEQDLEPTLESTHTTETLENPII